MLFCPSIFVDGFEIFKTCLTLSALGKRPLTKPDFVPEEHNCYLTEYHGIFTFCDWSVVIESVKTWANHRSVHVRGEQASNTRALE